jgi:hypothetical protein
LYNFVKPTTIGSQAPVQIEQTYGSTIYNTVVVTVVVDEEEPPKTEEDPLSFIVVDGTTSWIGETPTSGASLIFATSVAVVTLVPQQTPVLSDDDLEPTTTRKRTLTSAATIVASATSTSTVTHGGVFTGQPTAGWNGTSSSEFLPSSVVQSSTQTIETTSTAASSLYTTLVAPELTTNVHGTTTAVVDGSTLSWSATSSDRPSTLSTPLGTAISTLSTVTSSSSFSSILVALNATIPGEAATASSTTGPTIPTASACGITGDFTLTVSRRLELEAESATSLNVPLRVERMEMAVLGHAGDKAQSAAKNREIGF